ncbi:MAG TPA: carboxypeptidase M32 [Gammaproteobacteria bacterium]|nr:carboxypeptidase M32 [Gammaproteobacteria bacterium]HIL98029.1 carboxypeptidase M32 [Pseudomonadales bacterium]
MSAYQNVHDHFREINDLQHVLAITNWDEASMMPVGGGQVRGQALSALQVVIHGLKTDPKIADWLEAAVTEDLDNWQSANLREIKRVYREATCMPADLVARLEQATTAAEQAWRQYRIDNNWADMEPLLTEVVNLSRKEAAVRAEATGLSKYDALLDTYEPNVNSARVDEVFGDLKSFLPGFIEAVIEKQSSETLLPVSGDFSIAKQRELGMAVMESLGFDFDHGRLDVSHHPFCGGVPDDVRITTRYQTDTFVTSLMGVIHETGHAMYEQGLPVGWRDQPVGRALSMATHESQSLLMEMQVARTKQFLQFLTPIAQRIFLGGLSNDPAWNVENLHRLYTKVKRSYIRVDADEATYPLHVILRYELEKDLIEGSLEVRQLPDAWDAKMQEYFDLSTAGNFHDGCMQDVHWPSGLFGYFPTYTLGAMTAAQLFSAAMGQVDDLLGSISRGDFTPLLSWLRTEVHGKGKYLNYDELMLAATGDTLDAGYFKSHLEARYLQ